MQHIWFSAHQKLCGLRLGRCTLVEVSNLVTLVSLGVAEFESCTSQKNYATTWITLKWLGVFHAINSGFKWARSMITRMSPFFRSFKKKKLYGFVCVCVYIYIYILLVMKSKIHIWKINLCEISITCLWLSGTAQSSHKNNLDINPLSTHFL